MKNGDVDQLDWTYLFLPTWFQKQFEVAYQTLKQNSTWHINTEIPQIFEEKKKVERKKKKIQW